MRYRLGRVLVAMAAVVLAAATANAVGPRSIFDDDWTPPKSNESRPTRPTPATLPAAAAATPRTIDPAPDVTPKNLKPIARRPVPTKAEQAAARKVLKEVYAEQLVDRSIPARRKLTEALLHQAEGSIDAPVDQFVLLAAAIDAGNEAVDLPLTLQACDQMARAFDVDELAVKVDSATKLISKSASPESTAANVRAGLQLVDQLVEAEDFVAAGHICTALVPATARNQALRSEVVNRQRDMNAARDASEKAARYFAKLKSAPDDPAANLEVGKYLCFYKNDWNAGLPALARGADATLKALAAKELAGADSAEAQAALGDAWWNVAEASNPATKATVEAHALEWYKKAVGALNGLGKAKVEKRLALATAAAAAQRAAAEPWVVLFRSQDPAIWGRDTTRGANGFAVKLSSAPKDTKWLRLSCLANGKAVIIPITADALSQQTLVSSDFGWEGTADFNCGAYHLGIWGEKLALDHRGMVAVGRAGHDHRGWGFGRFHQVDTAQGYSWGGEELTGPVVFEIAVKSGTLTDAEQKAVLVVP